MFQDRCYERDMDVNTNYFADNMENNIDYNIDYNINSNQPLMDNNMTSSGNPVMEPMQERCIHKTFIHEVPHVCPIRTKIINHHVYRHTYRPEYSCCEENVVSNIDNGSCSCFK